MKPARAGERTGRMWFPSSITLRTFERPSTPPMLSNRWIDPCGKSLKPKGPSPPRHRSRRYFIWPLQISPKNGQCRYGAGSQRWISLRSSSVTECRCDKNGGRLWRHCFTEFIAWWAKTKLAQGQLILSLSRLSRHHPDAQVALQQSPILQDDNLQVNERAVKNQGRSGICHEPLRPFTQLNEHSLGISTFPEF